MRFPWIGWLLVIVAFSACKKEAGNDLERSASVSEPQLPPVSSLLEFDTLCRGGKVAPTAAAYEKAPGKASPTVFLVKDVGATEYVVASWPSVDAWKAADPKQAQLVVCLDITSSKKERECNLSGSILEQHQSTNRITVFEAKSGKKLDEQTVERPAPQGCPTSFWFKSARQINFGDVGLFMGSVVAKFQPADAPSLPVTVWDMREACSGKPAFGGGAYQSAAGSKNVGVVFRSSGDGLFWQEDSVANNINWDARLKEASENKAKVNAVVCMTSERKGKALSCPYYGGGPLQVFNASWKVAVVEPSTGKTVGSTTLVGKPSCPDSWKFSRGSELDAPPSDDALKAFMKPILDP